VNVKTIIAHARGAVNRAVWRRVEWLALRLLAASSRRLIAHRQARRVHSEAHKGVAVIPAVYAGQRSARLN
jgi:hypothetical protein